MRSTRVHDTASAFIAGNWKMYKTVDETVKYVKEFRGLVKDIQGVEIVLAPPFTALHAAAEAARNSNVGMAAQDMHWEREGAFTGEVSGADDPRGRRRVRDRRPLRAAHAVRRDRRHREPQGRGGVRAGLTPIVCIGETLDQRERSETFEVLDRQMQQGLDGVTAEQVGQLVIAYEPVWAIGTGRNATPAQAAEAHAHIRGRLRQWFGPEAAELCHVIYGGSVKPDNIGELLAQPDVDGALVGGASLDVRGFVEIVTRSRGTAA